jgi:hypothetical protein
MSSEINDNFVVDFFVIRGPASCVVLLPANTFVGISNKMGISATEMSNLAVIAVYPISVLILFCIRLSVS